MFHNVIKRNNLHLFKPSEMLNRGFDMPPWNYVLVQKETFRIFVFTNIFFFGVNEYYYANMKDQFILLLLGIIQIKCWTTIPIRISKTNPVYPNTALNSLALICPKMESQCIGHQKRVLRASETEIMVGAVGKHSRRMEYPKIPENIPGIQVTFT